MAGFQGTFGHLNWLIIWGNCANLDFPRETVQQSMDIFLQILKRTFDNQKIKKKKPTELEEEEKEKE